MLYLKIKFFLFLLFWFFNIGSVYGNSGNIVCDNNSYFIEGNDYLKTNSVGEFYVRNSKDEIIDNVYFYIKNDNINEYSFFGKKLTYHFINQGSYSVEANLYKNDCFYELKKDINLYNKGVTYFYNKKEDNINLFNENFKKNNILFNQYDFLVEENNSINLTYLKDSDIIIINNENFLYIFDYLYKYKDIINFGDKKFFIVTNKNTNYIKRILSKYINDLSITKFYIFDNNYLISFINSISLGIRSTENQFIDKYSFDINKKSPKYMFISYIIDDFISKGVHIKIISNILLLFVIILFLVISKQIIGFEIFGIYYYLVILLSLSLFGFYFSIILFLISFLSIFITRYLITKIYLQSNIKDGLIIMLQLFFIIIIFYFLDLTGFYEIKKDIFSNNLFIFATIFILFTINKIFYENIKLSKRTIFEFIEFIIIVFIGYILFKSEYLNYLLFSFPETIFFLIILLFFIGRFTGLQLVEYYRFKTLFGKYDIEE